MSRIIDTREPSAYEYGMAMSKIHRELNVWPDWCVTHNNLGWLGYNVKAPTSERIEVFRSSNFGDKYYTISGIAKLNGVRLNNDTKFASIEDVMTFLTNELKNCLQK